MGLVLCDAPGLGKTLSVLATIVHSQAQSTADDKLVIIFADNRGLVAQWVSQIDAHFEPEASGLQVFCDPKQTHFYASAHHGARGRGRGRRLRRGAEGRPAAGGRRAAPLQRAGARQTDALEIPRRPQQHRPCHGAEGAHSPRRHRRGAQLQRQRCHLKRRAQSTSDERHPEDIDQRHAWHHPGRNLPHAQGRGPRRRARPEGEIRRARSSCARPTGSASSSSARRRK